MQGIEGKVALVTGAGSGIGRASALAFARAGARVVVSDVDLNAAEQTGAMIAAVGGKVLAFRADVTRFAEVGALVRAAVETFGGLQLAHNNAGMLGATGDISVCSEEN